MTELAQPPHLLASMLVGLAMYVAVGVLLIWTGAGSCAGRRWVRPVVMIASTPTMLFGVLAMLGTLVVMIGTQTATRPGIQPNLGMATLIGMGIAAGFELLAFVVLPIILFIFTDAVPLGRH